MEIIYENRKQEQKRIVAQHLDRFERNDLLDFDMSHKRASQKEKDSSPTNKARKETSRDKLVEKREMPDGVESLKKN